MVNGIYKPTELITGFPGSKLPSILGLTGPNTFGHHVEGDHTAWATLRIPKTGFYAVRTYENMRWYTIDTQKLDWTKASSHPVSHDIREGCWARFCRQKRGSQAPMVEQFVKDSVFKGKFRSHISRQNGIVWRRGPLGLTTPCFTTRGSNKF